MTLTYIWPHKQVLQLWGENLGAVGRIGFQPLGQKLTLFHSIETRVGLMYRLPYDYTLLPIPQVVCHVAGVASHCNQQTLLTSVLSVLILYIY